jgi:thiol-disulfide isomerase/thioredoxin
MHSLADFACGHALLVVFTCGHCPFVRHMRGEFARYAREYRAKGLAVVAINSNDLAAYPQDGPDGMRAEAAELRYDFPYLLDETQAVAHAYRAACTPDSSCSTPIDASLIAASSTTAGPATGNRSRVRICARVGRSARRTPARRGAEAQRRLQYQVETGQRAPYARKWR